MVNWKAHPSFSVLHFCHAWRNLLFFHPGLGWLHFKVGEGTPCACTTCRCTHEVDWTKAGRFPLQLNTSILFSSLKSGKERRLYAGMDIHSITGANMPSADQHKTWSRLSPAWASHSLPCCQACGCLLEVGVPLEVLYSTRDVQIHPQNRCTFPLYANSVTPYVN